MADHPNHPASGSSISGPNRNPSGSTATGCAERYLTFELAGEVFGVEILRVREIIGLMPVVAVPGMASYVRGVINLRGNVIPVLDLRSRLGFPPVSQQGASEGTQESGCIIVVAERTSTEGTAGKDKLRGMVVDRVRDVQSIDDSQIEPTSEIGAALEQRFVQGLGKVGNEVRILLELDAVLGHGTDRVAAPREEPEEIVTGQQAA